MWKPRKTDSTLHRVLLAGIATLSLLAMTCVSLLVTSTPAAADATGNDYPTSISGCRPVAGGPATTCDLKDSAQDTYYDPWGEENRECTSAVAWWLHERNGFEMPFYDNAVNWGTRASALGYTVNMTPAIGAVAWWTSPQHVAWVESINGSNVVVEQYNADYTGHYSTATIAANSVSGYIHFKDLVTTSSLSRPAAVSFNGNLQVYTRANDNHIYGQTWNGTSWSGYTSLGSGFASDPAAIVNGTAVNIFARGTDNRIYTEYFSAAGPSGWASLGATTMQGNPKVVQYGSDLEVFALGTDRHPYQDTWNPTTGWSGFTNLGDYMSSDPMPVQYGSNLEIIMRGGDNAVYYDVSNGSSWSGFGYMAGTITGDPAVIQYGSFLNVLTDTPGQHIYMNTYNGTGWGGWADHGGNFVGDPALMQYNNDMEFFVLGTDGHIYTRWWSAAGQTWGGWNSLGGTNLASAPTAIQYGTELDVFANGTDGHTYKDTFNATTGWGGFTVLPG